MSESDRGETPQAPTPVDEALLSCKTTSDLERRILECERRITEQEVYLIEQEHRAIPVWKNFFEYKNVPGARRQSAIRAFFTWLLFGGSPAVAAISGMSLVGLYIAWTANNLLEAQNALLQQEAKQSERRDQRARKSELIKAIHGRIGGCGKDERVCSYCSSDCPDEHKVCPHASQKMERWDAIVEFARLSREYKETDTWRERHKTPFFVSLPRLGPVCLRQISEAYVDLSGIELAMSDFSDSRLMSLKANYSGFQQVNFSETYLDESDLTGSILMGTNFSNATLSNSSLKDTLIVGANFSNADLSNTNFSGSDLTNRIAGCDPEHPCFTKFNGALLLGADLSRIILPEKSHGVHVSWAGAKYDGKTRFPEDFDPSAQGMIASN